MNGLAMVPVLLALAGAPNSVEFPGPVKSIRSPASEARVVYVDRGRLANDLNDRRLYLEDGGRRILIDRFDGNVEVAWAPSGRRFFVNDLVGSNVADCLVVRPAGRTISKISLTTVADLSRHRPRPPGDPGQAHYYVTCYRWLSGDRLAGHVWGHSDTMPMRAFDHPFIFDAATERIVWRRSR